MLKEWKNEKLPVTPEELVEPKNTALLVIDMQNDFIAENGFSARGGNSVTEARAIIPAINGLIEAARKASVPVVYIRTTHSLDTDSVSYRARYALRKMDLTKPLICQEGTWGSEIDPEILPKRSDERCITKYSYDAFLGTDLDSLLRAWNVQTVITVGVNTNVCVQTTAEHAFGLGYHLVVPEDCVAGSTVEAHEAAIRNFRIFFGTVTDSETIKAAWSKR